MKNLLFTTPSCPNCPTAKNLLGIKGVEFDLVDASTKEGLEMARKFGVSSVPALIVLDDQNSIRDSARNLDEIEAFLSN